MTFTLHRYVFREVFKVFILATVALTLMMSLGSILRPVQEYGVGPRQVVHLMGYFLPITLTFVLPIAALFASALVYGRLANDNELDACRASGVSLLTLVYPGLALAIMVAIANLLLSFYVMPVFVRRAEKSLKDDAKQILFRNIQQKGYYTLPDGRWRIYADNADLQNNILSGIVATEVRNDKISRIIMAESARVSFDPHEMFNEVRITAHNAYQMGPAEDTGFAAEWLSLTAEFGSLMGDNIRFKKINEMKEIRLDPLRFYPVARLARRIYARFTAELLAQDINERISRKSDRRYKLYSNRKFVELSADHCAVRDDTQVVLSDNVAVTEYDLQTGQSPQTLRCSRALLDIEGDELAPTLTLDIGNALLQTGDGTENPIGRHIIRGLSMPQAVTGRFETANILAQLQPDHVSSALAAGPSEQLAEMLNQLRRTLDKTFADIDAELNSRLVFGIGCITLIMIGIGLGIILKGGHLLTAFAASVIPAMVLIVCIMMGSNIASNPGSQGLPGIVLMWAGLAVLSVLAIGLYHRLLKH
jgi:lipopolysaccharide export LptBFGC system permease protein LptF